MERYSIQREDGLWEIYDNRFGTCQRSEKLRESVKTTPIAYAYDFFDAERILKALNAYDKSK